MFARSSDSTIAYNSMKYTGPSLRNDNIWGQWGGHLRYSRPI